MPDNDPDTTVAVGACAKCGAGGNRYSYHRNWRSCSYGQHGYHPFDGEHLHVSCRTCGFDWRLPCAGQDTIPRESA